jgi:hypothetical protein
MAQPATDKRLALQFPQGIGLSSGGRAGILLQPRTLTAKREGIFS